MSLPSDDFVDSTPNPQTVTLVAALLRHVLTLLGGFGLTVGVYSDSKLTFIASALVSIGGIVWSLWQKYQAAKKDHEGSVRSAIVNKAVKAT